MPEQNPFLNPGLIGLNAPAPAPKKKAPASLSPKKAPTAAKPTPKPTPKPAPKPAVKPKAPGGTPVDQFLAAAGVSRETNAPISNPAAPPKVTNALTEASDESLRADSPIREARRKAEAKRQAALAKADEERSLVSNDDLDNRAQSAFNNFTHGLNIDEPTKHLLMGFFLDRARNPKYNAGDAVRDLHDLVGAKKFEQIQEAAIRGHRSRMTRAADSEAIAGSLRPMPEMASPTDIVRQDAATGAADTLRKYKGASARMNSVIENAARATEKGASGKIEVAARPSTAAQRVAQGLDTDGLPTIEAIMARHDRQRYGQETYGEITDPVEAKRRKAFKEAALEDLAKKRDIITMQSEGLPSSKRGWTDMDQQMLDSGEYDDELLDARLGRDPGVLGRLQRNLRRRLLKEDMERVAGGAPSLADDSLWNTTGRVLSQMLQPGAIIRAAAGSDKSQSEMKPDEVIAEDWLNFTAQLIPMVYGLPTGASVGGMALNAATRAALMDIPQFGVQIHDAGGVRQAWDQMVGAMSAGQPGEDDAVVMNRRALATIGMGMILMGGAHGAHRIGGKVAGVTEAIREGRLTLKNVVPMAFSSLTKQRDHWIHQGGLAREHYTREELAMVDAYADHLEEIYGKANPEAAKPGVRGVPSEARQTAEFVASLSLKAGRVAQRRGTGTVADFLKLNFEHGQDDSPSVPTPAEAPQAAAASVPEPKPAEAASAPEPQAPSAPKPEPVAASAAQHEITGETVRPKEEFPIGSSHVGVDGTVHRVVGHGQASGRDTLVLRDSDGHTQVVSLREASRDLRPAETGDVAEPAEVDLGPIREALDQMRADGTLERLYRRRTGRLDIPMFGNTVRSMTDAQLEAHMNILRQLGEIQEGLDPIAHEYRVRRAQMQRGERKAPTPDEVKAQTQRIVDQMREDAANQPVQSKADAEVEPLMLTREDETAVQKLGEYDADADVIRLFKGSDATTVIHELAHRWLEKMPASFGREFLDFLGYKDTSLAEIKDATGGEYRDVQEHFARGLERYLLDGVAPSKGMRRFFDAAKNYFRGVYAGVKRNAGPTEDPRNIAMSPKLRGIFDKVFATDREMLPARATIPWRTRWGGTSRNQPPSLRRLGPRKSPNKGRGGALSHRSHRRLLPNRPSSDRQRHRPNRRASLSRVPSLTLHRKRRLQKRGENRVHQRPLRAPLSPK